ncbi:hypothetical protein HK100_002211 [Physocladia obscura]|uniref:Thiamin pyrophosphokinase catalytic domain-containing protein n=1 Tax=Physocladia obscura TaxID=109957 RepID=A0AAD5XAE5_9FUNG|nr:hypothetical protein HK100_002211 [Physocladia obscura]
MQWNISQFLDPNLTQTSNRKDESNAALSKFAPPIPPPHALIILNQPVCNLKYLKTIWANAALKICADGGANRLYDSFSILQEYDSDAVEAQRSSFLPDLIKGDLDSIRPKVKQYYIEKVKYIKEKQKQKNTASIKSNKIKGVTVELDHDQYSTDFGKCIAHVEKFERTNMKPTSPRLDILAMGALGGRFDQTIASVFQVHNELVKFDDTKNARKVYLISNESVAVLLIPV